MTERNDRIDDGIGTDDVVLLAEQEMSDEGAAEVVALHDEIADQVVYHVLIPVEDAAARIEAAMGSLATGEVMTAPAVTLSETDLAEVRRECLEHSQHQLDLAVARLQAAGVEARGTVSHEHPIAALATDVAAPDGPRAEDRHSTSVNDTH